MTRIGFAALVAMASSAGSAVAQDAMSIGQFEFANSCVQCHGTAGKGDGPLVSFLTGSMPDITQLQKSNGGVFPVTRVFNTIDGSARIGAHGTSEMPAWGQRYRADAAEWLSYQGAPGEAEALAQLRVLALVEYVASLQEQ
ncbi:MAG: c-type cytochrome [Tabrizicola sp.]|nr:c-type cytochrome [Tabrizicola sp.]